jgi:hypothetical protein
MKRLIDEEHDPDSPEHALADLVRAMPRLEPASFQRQRILARVTTAARGTRGGPWTAIATAGSILAAATLAAAAVAHFRVVNASHPARVAAATAPLPPVFAPPAAAPPLEVATSDDPAPADVLPAPPAANAPPERPSTRLRATAPFKDGEDPALVLEAIRALRYNGDPSGAGVLLAQYLKAHPHGVLSEDALALSIEAAIARHDRRSATELARRYLAQFPDGRYRAFALQTAQTTPP